MKNNLKEMHDQESRARRTVCKKIDIQFPLLILNVQRQSHFCLGVDKQNQQFPGLDEQAQEARKGKRM